MTGRLPSPGGRVEKRWFSAAGVRPKSSLAPASALLAREGRKNLRRVQSSMIMPPPATELYNSQAGSGVDLAPVREQITRRTRYTGSWIDGAGEPRGESPNTMILLEK